MDALLAKGYRIAGSKAGTSYAIYRPFNAMNPISILSKVGDVQAAFDARSNFAFGSPNEYGDARWYALHDRSLTRPGDYLVGAGGAYFIAAQQPLLPSFCISCNATVSLRRPIRQSAIGAVAYAGGDPDREVEIMAGWPIALLLKGGGAVSDGGLPGEPSVATLQATIPVISDDISIAPQRADILVDGAGLRYVVRSSEGTDLGFRLTIEQAGP